MAMIESDRHLSVVLAGLSLQPGVLLCGTALSQLVAFLVGYGRAQALNGDVSILSGELLGEFGVWLSREKKAVGSDWYWRVMSMDASDGNAVTALRLFGEFLEARGTPVSPSEAADWFAQTGHWAPGAFARK
jgi:hypothetical protein